MYEGMSTDARVGFAMCQAQHQVQQLLQQVAALHGEKSGLERNLQVCLLYGSYDLHFLCSPKTKVQLKIVLYVQNSQKQASDLGQQAHGTGKALAQVSFMHSRR
jgi:hypothetical protein